MDIHVVKPGDTLYSIALSHGVPMSRLLEDNNSLTPPGWWWDRPS